MSSEIQPYVGPRPYERDEQALFFGRERESNDLLSLVVAHAEVLLYAESGAGKSSLLNAGLIPLLEREGFQVLPPARVSSPIPKGMTAEEIPNRYVFNVLTSWVKDEAAQKRLVQATLYDFLKEREHPLDADGEPVPRVVIFDQFEELFTLYPERWKDRKEFIEQVGNALKEDPLLRVVLAMREDYIAQLDPYTSLLPEKLRTRFRLERLRQATALLAVKEPLKNTARSFAEGAAEKLVEDLVKIRVETSAGESVEVTGEFIEPVQLQVVCQSLWRDLPPNVTVITQDDLRVLGDVNRALSGFYERSVKDAIKQTRAREGVLREWFEHALITPAGTRGTVYRGKEKTGGVPNTAVQVLEDLHLIRGEWRAGSRWYELTHDRFIKPIQRSNADWYARRRSQWLRIAGGAVTAILIVALVVICASTILLSIGRAQLSQTSASATTVAGQVRQAEAAATAVQYQSQATATAVAGQVRQVEATATAGAVQASQVQATATAAALVFTGTIKSDNTELRSSPSECSPVVGLLPQGTRLTVRSRSTDNAWLRVEAVDGTAGWAPASAMDLGRTSLSAIPFAAMLANSTPPSKLDDIQNLQTRSSTGQELQFTVDYSYNTDHGDNVFLGAYALKGGDRLAWFGYGPAGVRQGNGCATIRLTFGFNSPPASVTTDQVQVTFYIGGGSSFYSKTFSYVKTWSMPQGLATPVQLSPANGTVFNQFPRTTTLQWSAVPGAATYTIEIDCYLCCASNKWCTDVGRTFVVVPNIKGTNYVFNFVGAQPGRWRVWAVDASGHEGPSSAWWEFRYTK